MIGETQGDLFEEYEKKEDPAKDFLKEIIWTMERYYSRELMAEVFKEFLAEGDGQGEDDF